MLVCSGSLAVDIEYTWLAQHLGVNQTDQIGSTACSIDAGAAGAAIQLHSSTRVIQAILFYSLHSEHDDTKVFTLIGGVSVYYTVYAAPR
jgi:hypothetical protein